MRVENPAAQTYFHQESKSQNWSVRHLKRNLDSMHYGRILSISENGAAENRIEMQNSRDLKSGTGKFLGAHYLLD
jgi:predicted nuclease of restriction endonuclease-like (RecB) superfamily